MDFGAVPVVLKLEIIQFSEILFHYIQKITISLEEIFLYVYRE